MIATQLLLSPSPSFHGLGGNIGPLTESHGIWQIRLVFNLPSLVAATVQIYMQLTLSLSEQWPRAKVQPTYMLANGHHK